MGAAITGASVSSASRLLIRGISAIEIKAVAKLIETTACYHITSWLNAL
jgi:hypothetical protein